MLLSLTLHTQPVCCVVALINRWNAAIYFTCRKPSTYRTDRAT
jgi:hypothetical protein